MYSHCIARLWPCSLQARFTIFMPVQALDLAIVTASSGVLCKHPVTDHATPWQCVATALVGHILVAYLTVGALVWYMDRQARRTFVLQRQLVRCPTKLYCQNPEHGNLQCNNSLTVVTVTLSSIRATGSLTQCWLAGWKHQLRDACSKALDL